MLQFPVYSEAYRRDRVPCSTDLRGVQKIDTDSEGWSIPARMLGHSVILFAERGGLSVTLNGKAHMLVKGSVLLAAAGTRLALSSDGSACFYLLQFDCSELSIFTAQKQFCIVTLPTNARNTFAELYRAARTDGERLCGDCYLLLLLESIRKSHRTEPSLQKLYDAVCTYILDHAADDPSVWQVADALGYNKDHLCRAVRRCSGKTLRDLIAEERIRLAKGLLSSTNYSVEKIASLLHFSGANSFLKYFKYHVSMTPAEYRRKK